MAAQRDIRAEVGRHLVAAVAAPQRQLPAEAARQRRSFELPQFEQPLLLGDEVDERVDDFSFAAAPDDKIEIVGAGYSCAQKLDHRRTQPRRSDGERRQSDEFSFGVYSENRKFTLPSKMLPPAEQRELSILDRKSTRLNSSHR